MLGVQEEGNFLEKCSHDMSTVPDRGAEGSEQTLLFSLPIIRLLRLIMVYFNYIEQYIKLQHSFCGSRRSQRN